MVILDKTKKLFEIGIERAKEIYSEYRRLIRICLVAALVVATIVTAAPAAATVFKANDSAATQRKIPIYSVETPEKKASITFDAAWDSSGIDKILEVLRRNDVKATFFLCGVWIDRNPEHLKKIADEGHDIANHGNNHLDGTQLSLSDNKKEIENTHEKVKEAIGLDMNLYRPPYGEYNNTVVQAAEELGYYTVQWDVDSIDWQEHPMQEMIDRVLNHKKLKNGSILLFHNDAKYTPDALDTIIKGLKAKGYDLVPVSELIYREDFKIDHEGRQKKIN